LLKVADKNNQTESSSQSITIKQITIRYKKAQHIDSLDMKIERYSLCLFDFDQANSTPLHIKILNDVKKSIKPNSTLQIYGYTDRIGDAQHNKDLAQRRCEVVNRNINPTNTIKTQLEAVGNDKLIYDNNTPEGRAFSRTVRIEIHTPNK
jgi:outer membrane protein OmpA-like peptidoglycan-associated protein